MLFGLNEKSVPDPINQNRGRGPVPMARRATGRTGLMWTKLLLFGCARMRCVTRERCAQRPTAPGAPAHRGHKLQTLQYRQQSHSRRLVQPCPPGDQSLHRGDLGQLLCRHHPGRQAQQAVHHDHNLGSLHGCAGRVDLHHAPRPAAGPVMADSCDALSLTGAALSAGIASSRAAGLCFCRTTIPAGSLSPPRQARS